MCKTGLFHPSIHPSFYAYFRQGIYMQHGKYTKDKILKEKYAQEKYVYTLSTSLM